MTRCGFVGCTNRPVTASCVDQRRSMTMQKKKELAGGGKNVEKRLTLCSSVVRNRFVLRSQMHTLPSVAPVTTVFALEPSTAPTMLTKATASTLSPSVWPPRAEMTSPLLRLTTRTPPSAPPTTAIVEAGLTASEVIPPNSNRASSPVNLKIGVGERGSQ